MNILVIKLGAIGDVLMSTPALRAIKKTYPQSALTVMVGASCAAVLKGSRSVDNLMVIDDAKLYRGGAAAKLGVTASVWKRVRRCTFDMLFVFHRDRRFNLLSASFGIPRRYGFDRNGEGFFLTAGHAPVTTMHQIDQYLEVAKLAGVEADGRNMDFSVSAEAISKARMWLDERGVGKPMPVVALAPGGARNVRLNMDSKRWPIESYTKLTEELIATGLFKVILIGAPSDEFVVKSFSAPHLVVQSFVGKTSLEETAALMRACAVVVTHDSGPMHLASAMGTPVVALFGPTGPQEYYPMNPGSSHLWKPEGLPCCPCYQDGRFPLCPIDQACLRRITPEEIAGRLRALVPGPGRATAGD